jgi:hypothetical protein
VAAAPPQETRSCQGSGPRWPGSGGAAAAGGWQPGSGRRWREAANARHHPRATAPALVGGWRRGLGWAGVAWWSARPRPVAPRAGRGRREQQHPTAYRGPDEAGTDSTWHSAPESLRKQMFSRAAGGRDGDGHTPAVTSHLLPSGRNSEPHKSHSHTNESRSASGGTV